jgi:hypothetical protein
MANYKLIKLRFDLNSYHLLFERFLFKKNGQKMLKDQTKTQYYICLNCEVKGKILGGSSEFCYSGKYQVHNHEPPEDLTLYEEFVEKLKAEVSRSTLPIREIYVKELSR